MSSGTTPLLGTVNQKTSHVPKYRVGLKVSASKRQYNIIVSARHTSGALQIDITSLEKLKSEAHIFIVASYHVPKGYLKSQNNSKNAQHVNQINCRSLEKGD